MNKWKRSKLTEPEMKAVFRDIQDCFIRHYGDRIEMHKIPVVMGAVTAALIMRSRPGNMPDVSTVVNNFRSTYEAVVLQNTRKKTDIN